jgi:hypothetical protein
LKKKKMLSHSVNRLFDQSGFVTGKMTAPPFQERASL